MTTSNPTINTPTNHFYMNNSDNSNTFYITPYSHHYCVYEEKEDLVDYENPEHQKEILKGKRLYGCGVGGSKNHCLLRDFWCKPHELTTIVFTLAAGTTSHKSWPKSQKLHFTSTSSYTLNNTTK